MPVPYAKSYIDRLYDTKEMLQLFHVVSVAVADRKLPEQFWLFVELWQWLLMAPGGIWEYYDGRQIDAVEKVAHTSERFGLTEIALKYRSGMSEWNKPSRCRALDRWIQEQLKDSGELNIRFDRKGSRMPVSEELGISD